MICKIARNCIGLVSKLERSVRPNQIRNPKRVGGMTTTAKPQQKHDKSRDHLIRTLGSSRQDLKFDATVIEIEKLSTTVRGLKLVTSEVPHGTTFKAGQWVDMEIPGVKTVGGFSVCSPPYEFETNGTLEFAIKYANHPPAKWIHEQVHIGSSLTIQFGGDFSYDPVIHDHTNLLLIAGGVGIVPLYSILRQRHHLSSRNIPPVSTRLLYSARTTDELLFKENIKEICDEMRNSRCDFFITREEENPTSFHRSEDTHHRRISQNSLQKISREFYKNQTCFICGPPNFIDTMVNYLRRLGLPLSNINFEKWW